MVSQTATQPKTVFITVGRAPAMHNIMRTDFWEEFQKQTNAEKYVILVKPEKEEEYRKELQKGKTIVVSIDPRPTTKLTTLLDNLAANGINTNTVKWLQMTGNVRGKSGYLATLGKRIYSTTLGSSNLYKKILRKLIFKYSSYNEDVRSVLGQYQPDVIYATSLTNFEFDIPVAIEAKRRNIKVVSTIRSWDNLTSHGLLRVNPNKLFLQNNFLIDMAKKHQALKKGTVVKTPYGLPHYDKYKNQDVIISREEFCRGLGLDPNKKIILYGAMGDFLFPHEGGIAQVFEDLIEQGKIKEPAQVIFRAHPAFKSPLETMKNLKHVRGDRGGTYLNEHIKSFEMKNTDMIHLINSIHHADVNVTAASTMAVDGAALDRPTVCINFDGTSKNVKRWESVNRFYDTYTHFEDLIKTGGANLVNTPDELATAVNEYIKNPEKDSAGREKIRNRFISRYQADSGTFLANLVAETVR